MTPTNWQWYQLSKNNDSTLKEIKTEINDVQFDKWTKELHQNNSNLLKLMLTENGEKLMYGSLIYKQDFEKESEKKICHFYVTENLLVMIDLDFSIFKHNNIEMLEQQIDQSQNAIDGFLLILGELVNELLISIDEFEVKLEKLIWNVRKNNNSHILDKIYEVRHQLFVMNNLLIPIKELEMGMNELYLNEVSSDENFHRTCKRIDRAISLLNGYEDQIDSIINLEEVISSHRGNEIMKTLTVITTLFTPVTVFGALWGMNFKHIPELKWQYGYGVALIVIIISTLMLYAYLRLKGWTGDLLKGNKKGSLFK